MATRGPMTLRSGSLPKMVACVFISVPFFFFKSFFMLRGRRFSFVFIVSFASSSSFRPFSFSYRRGSRFESLGGCFLFFF